MECSIHYVGKQRNGKAKYWCSIHKEKASDKEGNRLQTCLCEKKEDFAQGMELAKQEIKEIKIFFPNLFHSNQCEIRINQQLLNGVLKIENSILEEKNFIGVFLTRLNQMENVLVFCNHCGHLHNDNGTFAITPHRKHLCHYCGHEFYVKSPNIGSEILYYVSTPLLKIENRVIILEDTLCVEYDLLKGTMLINQKKGDKLLIDGIVKEATTVITKLLEKR